MTFVSCLTEAIQKYTNVDPTSHEGTLFLHTHFISQSAPHICKKFQKLEWGPQAPQKEIIQVAFKVFNNRQEEKAQAERQKGKERKAA